ncbi:MAG: putative metalloprotease CJM1_0395 family protein [Colwellia sp.]|jgi:hypothetical protein
MNITPQAPTLSIPTAVNLQTDSLRRDNNIREVIAKPAAPSQSAADKAATSEKEKSKTPAQNSENIDFESISKQAQLEASTINGESDRKDSSSDEKSSAEDFLEKKAIAKKEAEKNEALQNAPNGSLDPESQKEFAEQKIINELKLRDQEVRTHELAHASVGGPSTGAPSYTFEVGPDGKKYAVAGEVSVDLSAVDGNPRATIAKMQKVHAAALAPANPSIQDTRVAASAARSILQAQSELAAINLEDPSRAKDLNIQIKPNDVFAKEGNEQSEDFDTLVNRTLASQEEIAPNRDISVDERALRIESFYSGIIQAYEKDPSSHFQLTA